MSFTPAKRITSPQQGPHGNLESTVRKHFGSFCQKPIAAHNRLAFQQAQSQWEALGRPTTILDSGCGTGESSRHLANAHPDCLVIGIDQSIKRLAHRDNQELTDNCLLLRTECSDFWRLAEQSHWCFTKHTLLYPNPYPKSKHLQRRWHGGASWTSVLAISKNLEMRTNWHIYAQEFYQALLISEKLLSRFGDIQLNSYVPKESITAFERKYQASGHDLWQVKAFNVSSE